jgi:hypothetical protein
MGIRLEQISHLLPLMSSADQARYGGVVNVARDSGAHGVRDDGVVHGVRDGTPIRSSKRDASEKKEQGEFASWLSLQRSKGRKIPFVWHATHTRSKATPGCPDFWVGVAGRGIWFEFKRDDTCKLTTEQEEFRSACAAQHIEHYVVYSSQQAIDVVETAAGPGAPSAALRSRVTIGGTADAAELL